MHPKATVVIPAFNRERYVGEAIGSVLAQTFVDFDLIVVDDGSRDRTGEVVRAFCDPRVHCLNVAHGGIAAAMNAGLRAARGDYVARLDSDDIWLPDMLATQVALLDAHPEVGVAYARAQGMDEHGRLTGEVWGVAQHFPQDSLRSMLYGDFTCNITVVARRACIERAGLYDESLQTSEDWDLWLRVSKTTTFAFTDRVLARFRRHRGNMTGPDSPHFRGYLEDRTKVLDKFFAAADLSTPILEMKSVAYSNVHTGVGLMWLRYWRYREARAAFVRAIGASDRPLRTMLRIGLFIVNWNVLSRRSWGRWLIDRVSARCRSWRAR